MRLRYSITYIDEVIGMKGEAESNFFLHFASCVRTSRATELCAPLEGVIHSRCFTSADPGRAGRGWLAYQQRISLMPRHVRGV